MKNQQLTVHVNMYIYIYHALCWRHCTSIYSKYKMAQIIYAQKTTATTGRKWPVAARGHSTHPAVAVEDVHRKGLRTSGGEVRCLNAMQHCQ